LTGSGEKFLVALMYWRTSYQIPLGAPRQRMLPISIQGDNFEITNSGWLDRLAQPIELGK